MIIQASHYATMLSDLKHIWTGLLFVKKTVMQVKLAPISEKFSRREEILEDEAYFKDSLTSVSIFLKHIQVSNLPAWAKPLASDILR